MLEFLIFLHENLVYNFSLIIFIIFGVKVLMFMLKGLEIFSLVSPLEEFLQGWYDILHKIFVRFYM